MSHHPSPDVFVGVCCSSLLLSKMCHENKDENAGFSAVLKAVSATILESTLELIKRATLRLADDIGNNLSDLVKDACHNAGQVVADSFIGVLSSGNQESTTAAVLKPAIQNQEPTFSAVPVMFVKVLNEGSTSSAVPVMSAVVICKACCVKNGVYLCVICQSILWRLFITS